MNPSLPSPIEPYTIITRKPTPNFSLTMTSSFPDFSANNAEYLSAVEHLRDAQQQHDFYSHKVSNILINKYKHFDLIPESLKQYYIPPSPGFKRPHD